MKTVLIAGVIAAAFVAVSPNIQAAQTAPQSKPAAKAPDSKMPAAVEAAFKKAYPNATVKNVSKEKEDGQEQYEIESIDGGHRRDLNYKPDGTLISYEEEITEAMVPPAVVSAIKAKYPKATFSTTEKLFKDGTMSYEIGLKGAKAKEVTLSADGKWIEPKEK
jgi:hypothetical protein